MRRDLHVMEQICFCGEQELGRAQAPQLAAVIRSYMIDIGGDNGWGNRTELIANANVLGST